MFFLFVFFLIIPKLLWSQFNSKIVFQFQLRGSCVSKCWAQANSWFHGRSPKETLTAICFSTKVPQVGFFFFFYCTHSCTKAHARAPLYQKEAELNFEILEEGSHYDLDFLSVRKDYVIYFLSKLLWRDYTLERYRGLRVCLVPRPSLRQGRVSAAYVQPVSTFWKWGW